MRALDVYYHMEVLKTEKDLSILVGFYYSHIPEAVEAGQVDVLRHIKNEKIQIRYHADKIVDASRCWILASVWFNDNPIMIIQNAGRDGDDHACKYVTLLSHYIEMVTYIKGLIKPEFDEITIPVIDLEKDMPELTEFYGDRVTM